LPRDLPRKTDLQALTQKKFDETILTHTLNPNSNPKKCLHWTTFLKAFYQYLNIQFLAVQA
jgi:IS30 family transposase